MPYCFRSTCPWASSRPYPLLHCANSSAEQVACLTHALGIGIGEGEHAAAQDQGDLVGVDAVVLGFTAMDELHVEGVAQDEWDVFLLAAVGEPAPGKHALDADNNTVAELSDGFQEGLGVARDVAVEDDVTGLVEDAQVQSP